MVIKVKLNNKGFAISTIVYGLAVMGMLLIAMIMATLSNNRTNTNQLSKSIEEELNRISKRTATFEARETSDGGSSMPEAQEYRVPEGQSGWYRIELWGAQGGGNGGYGAYTSGITYLEEGSILFFYLGEHKSAASSGRETDVRLTRGEYNDEDSLATRIMVAAGGGAGSKANGGTLTGGWDKSYAPGGTLNDSYALSGTLNGYASDYATGTLIQPAVGTTISSFFGTSKGGDGYYPSNSQNYGGISYISGYAGSLAMKDKKVINKSIYEYQKTTYNEEDNTYHTDGPIEKHYFIDGRMIAGVNKGDGEAKIERIVDKVDGVDLLNKKNPNLNGVYTVRDCNDNGVATKMIVMSSGNMKSVSPTAVTGKTKCKDFNIGAATNIDELAIWHGTGGTGLGKNLENNTIAVCKKSNCTTDGDWSFLKKTTNRTKYSETETSTGTRISAYQFDSTTTLPDTGTYYIQPVLSDTRFVTVESNTVSFEGKVRIDYLKGLRRQIWSIEKIATNEYKIIDTANYKALSIDENENSTGKMVVSYNDFNETTRVPSQRWNIIPLGNGTYTIESIAPRKSASTPSGALVGLTDSWNSASLRNYLVIGEATKSGGIEKVDGLRFKLIKLDY